MPDSPAKPEEPKRIDFLVTPDVPVYRPFLGIDIARVATYWSDVEYHWAVAYIYLLAEPRDKDAFSAYFSMRDWRKRKQLFFNQAQARSLPGLLKQEAQNLYAEFEERARARNTVVHGTWAYSPQREDVIYLAQPRELGVQVNRVFTGIENIAKGRRGEVSVDLGRGAYDEWDHARFEAVIAEMVAYKNRVMEYGNRVSAHSLAVLTRRLWPGT